MEGVQQGIAIELSEDLEITDTTITEEDGSGVDRGDFIDEIGSDVPFASRVGLLGITEGFENPDPIAIKAKDAKITGGGAYSVNVVTEGKRSAVVEASRIDVSTETLQMEQAALEVTTKMDGVEEVEITQTTTLTESANSVTLRKPIFAQKGSVDVFLNGKRQREGRNYTLRFNQSGALEQVGFEEAIPEGAELKFVMQQNLTRSNLVVANTSGEVSLVKNSKVTAGGVEMDVNRLSIDESHVIGSGSIDIHAETVLKLDNQSSVKANLLEQGSVQLTSDTILIDDQSLLAGSSRVALTADSNVEINGESQVRVGWADARGPRQGSVKDILWDSNNGKIVDQNGLSARGRFKHEASVIRKITSQYGNQGTINVIDINQPIDHAAVPHVSIKSGGISVENGSFTGDSGGIKSAIMMESENGIRISGDSAFRQFDQVAFNANSVEVLSGIDIESKSNRQDVYTGFFVVNSKEATTLSGGRLFGSLVVNAGGDISITDMELGYGETKLGSDVFKLDADGDIYLGSGELGVTGTAHSKMLNIEGRDVHIKGYGLMSQSGMGIIGSSRVELEGPAGIKTNAVGAQELVVKAPDVTIKEGVSIFAQLLPQQGLNVTGKVRISGVNSLNLKDSTVEAGSPQFFNETPVINLSGGQITLDNTSLSQYCHYDSPQMHGEIYVMNPSTLNGYKTTKISATGSFKLQNKSRIYMNIGQVVVNAEDISVENSEILSRNVRGPASGWVGRIELDARSAVNLTDAKLNSETISSGVRAEISLSGNSLNAENSEVRIFDEQKGKTGKIQLNFDESIKMDNSQILSVGSSHLTPNINGNDIIVKSKDLTMKDSLINGMVEGDGKEGKTRLDISGKLSLEDSFVGGLAEPLKLVENEALITDGSLGEVKNLGVGTEIVIPSDLGEIHGENLFHSFGALNVGSGQTAVLNVPEGVKNVFLRITGEQATKLNGVIQADQPNRNITLINKNGFELGPDVDVDQFSGIRLGAVDQLNFKDGSVFGFHGGDTESLSGTAADFNIQTDQLTGAVKLMGAALKGSKISEVGDAEISIYGDKIELLSSGISSANGADINLTGNKVDVRQAAVLHAISPAKGEGGDINIKSRELNMKGAGIRTSSVDGQAGDVNIDVDKANVYISSIESNNYFGKNSRAKFKTGDINLIARESLDAYRPLVALRSNTTGGTGNLSANVGSLTLDGLGLFATEIWVMAYRGNTGNLKIDADSIDARLVRFINTALDDRGKLTPTEMEVYGDVTINANEMNVHTAEIHTGTKRTEKNSTLGDITIDVENDLILNKLKISNYHGTARGMGADITLSAKNILNGMDPEKVDPTDYPSITGTGSLSFLAEENLELGRMKLESINTAPSRDLITQFKGNNISLGMDLGDDAAGVENVGIVYHGNSTSVQRVSIQGEGDVRFVSGVNLYAPELTLEAGSLDINNSKITLNGAYESGFMVRDEMALREGSTIHSLSPTGKGSSNEGGAKTLNIASGQLTLEANSGIWTSNAMGTSSDNKPIANLKIQSGSVSLDEAYVASSTFNQSKAGDVEIEAERLSLRDSVIGSANNSQADAGDVTINAGQAVLAENSFIANGLNMEMLDWGWDPFAPGDAGDIN
ncbi:MAG: filamentous hemagglutinin N-terminal domain-containing protein, partial [Limisphaerales bacterium]